MEPRTSVLVAYASRYGSTKGVAEFIAERLRGTGLTAHAQSVGTARDPAEYGAVVIGSAVHDMAWLPEAGDFVMNHRGALAERPLWLFSVGARDALSGPVGRRLALRYPDPKEIAGLRVALRPRDHQIFSGVVKSAHYSRRHRLLLRVLGERDGDYRDWRRIGVWADGIARTLAELPAPERAADARRNRP